MLAEEFIYKVASPHSMQEARLYPFFGYAPQARHCAFGFGGHFPVGEVRVDQTLPLSELNRRYEEALEEIASRMPSAQELYERFPQEQWEACQEFTGLEEQIDYRDDEGVVITHQSLLAPSLAINVSTTFLEAHLHNCATANLAVCMYFHGLEALGHTYTAYDLPTDFLPRIRLEQGDLAFTAPFNPNHETTHPRLEKIVSQKLGEFGLGHNIFSSGKLFGARMKEGTLEVLDGRFEGRIFASGRRRCEAAASLLHAATFQSMLTYPLPEWEE